MKKKVLILNGQYAPGYKGGGPIQSCVNMVENLCDYYDFYVLCADRDLNEQKPYTSVKVGEWNQVGHAKVFYMPPELQSLKGFERVLNETAYDYLYLNGFFSPIYTIRPLLLSRLSRLEGSKKNENVILTPRGDFTGGCESKKLKKYSYIYLMKIIGLYRNLLWHATSNIEANDIKKKFPNARVFTAPNFPAKYIPKEPITEKRPGELRLVFVSRIFPKKNIKYALEVLQKIHEGHVVYDIYGPMEDEDYWAECEKLIRMMPPNVDVTYCGEAEHDDIPHIFEQYHAFFFPTLGENYGHVIVEAMMNNCICILSKGVTPWDEYIDMLDCGARLDEQDKFVEIIRRFVEMDERNLYRQIRQNTDFIEEKVQSEAVINMYRKMME